MAHLIKNVDDAIVVVSLLALIVVVVVSLSALIVVVVVVVVVVVSRKSEQKLEDHCGKESDGKYFSSSSFAAAYTQTRKKLEHETE